MYSKCACVILNYNDAKTTIELINRIRGYSVFHYLNVVDNDSTDDSYQELMLFNSNHIRVIKTAQNGGYGFGNNFGVKYANDILKCNYVVVANPDVIFEENVIEKMLGVMLENNDVIVVAPTQLDIDGNITVSSAWNVPTAMRYILTAEYFIEKLYKMFTCSKIFFDDTHIEVDCVPGALLMVSVKKFLSLGGYDPDLFLYGEETTLGIKSKEKGYRTILLINSTYIHMHSVSINKLIKNEKTDYSGAVKPPVR